MTPAAAPRTRGEPHSATYTATQWTCHMLSATNLHARRLGITRLAPRLEMPCQAALLADEHILSASGCPLACSIVQNVIEHSVGGCGYEQTMLDCQTGSCSMLLIGC